MKNPRQIFQIRLMIENRTEKEPSKYILLLFETNINTRIIINMAKFSW